MALLNNTDLKALIADYLKRTDKTSEIPDWIRLAEKRIVRSFTTAGMGDLLNVKKTVTLAASTPLPQACRGLPQAIYLDTNPRKVLDYIAPEEINRMFGSTATGKPIAYTVIANDIIPLPAPDQSYSAVVVYRQEPDIAGQFDNCLIPYLTEDNFDNNPTGEGTFNGGSSHAANDVITMEDGSLVRVDTESGGLVLTFTVIGASLSSSIDLGDANLLQSSSTGSGTGFSLSCEADNVATYAFIKYPELYLYGALYEAFINLRNAKEAETYRGLFTETLDDIGTEVFHSAGALQLHLDHE